jgi:hypothetical protein
MQLTEVGCKCVVYGRSVVVDEGSSRRVEGTIKVRIVLSALEVRILVPSGVLKTR